jgi:hypothetical protein
VNVVRITYTDGHETYLRDPEQRGGFLCGVECNPQGVALREGCTEAPELRVRLDRLQDPRGVG